MLWIIMYLSMIFGIIFLEEYVTWGIRYVRVEVMNQEGIVLHDFGRYGIYALIFLSIMAICGILLLIINKRVYMTEPIIHNFEIMNYSERRFLFLNERIFTIAYKDEDNRIRYRECFETMSKVYIEEIEKPYILITEEGKKTPSKIENILSFMSSEIITYEIHISKEMFS